MKLGTKSLLFGAHQFLIHPLFVFIAWCKLYGFPFDPRLHLAFIIHDWGYWGKPNMDGKEGSKHPEWAANIMYRIFDIKLNDQLYSYLYRNNLDPNKFELRWFRFCLYHSRYYAKKENANPSKLCFADKLATVLEPKWLYLLKVKLTGEYKEYMAISKQRINAGQPQAKYANLNLDVSNINTWYNSMISYMKSYVLEHYEGKDDTWTPKT